MDEEQGKKQPGRHRSRSAVAASASRRDVEELFQSSECLVAMQTCLRQIIEDFEENPGQAEFNIHSYLDALEKAPQLIISESNPTWFLRREDGDPVAASRRLLKYWSSRVKIFGPDHAYRSVLNGDALDSESLVQLRSGFIVNLPSDSSGRSVIGVDSERRVVGRAEGGVPLARMKAGIFVLHQTFSNPPSQSDGIVFVSTYTQKSSLDLPSGKAFFEFIAEALPVRMQNPHYACCVPSGGRRFFLDHFIPSLDRCIGAERSRIPDKITHLGESPEELCRQLVEYGLQKNGLPEGLGGTWNYKRFSDFLDRTLSPRNAPEVLVDSEDYRKPAAISEPTSVPRSDTSDPTRASSKPSLTSVAAAPGANLHNETGSGAATTTKQPKVARDGTSGLPASDGKTDRSSGPALRSREVELFFQSTEELAAMQITLNKTIEDCKRKPEAEINIYGYLDALEKAPHLIISEANPTWFLRCEDGNAVAASLRLLKYWSSRVTVFGPELAYRSVLNGDALDSNLLVNLKAGVLVILPNDTSGRSVFCVDPRRRIARGTDKARIGMKMAFWNLSHSLSNPKTQSEGIVFVRRLSADGSMDTPVKKPFNALIAEAMPLKVHSRRFVCCVPRGAKRMFLDQFAPGVERTCGVDEYPEALPRAIFHVTDTLEELSQELGKHGLEKESLPESLGGTWDYQRFVDFVDRQLSSSSLVPGAGVEGESNRKPATVSVSTSVPRVDITDMMPSPHRRDGRGLTFAATSPGTHPHNEEGSPTTTTKATTKKRKLEVVHGSSSGYRTDDVMTDRPPGPALRSREVELFFQSSEELAAMQIVLNQTIEDFKRNAEADINIYAYLEALEKIPHLIISESNPTWFLRCEDGNTVAASRRLLKYWSSRVEIFGPDLAYRSVLKGDALETNFLERVKVGAFATLPNDTSGRAVYCFDPRRRVAGLEDASRARTGMQMAFWNLSQSLSNPKTQSEGIVYVWSLSAEGSMNLLITKPFYGLMAEVMPLKVHSRHIACCVPRGAKRLFLDQFAPGANRMCGADDYPEAMPEAIYHVTDSLEELSQELGKHGLKKHSLPASLGGTWDYQRFGDFVDKQLSSRSASDDKVQRENSRKRAAVSQSTSGPRGNITKTTKLALISSSHRRDGTSLTSVSTAQGDSIENGAAVHAGASLAKEAGLPTTRTKKHKLLSRKSGTNDQAEGDDQESSRSPYSERAGFAPNTASLKTAVHPKPGKAPPKAKSAGATCGQSSEGSLQKLQTAVETIPAECFDKGTTEEEKASYVRKRNAIYSRRKYYKDKLKVESLTNSRDSLEAENIALKEENRRLEKLHRMAQSATRLHRSGVDLSLPLTTYAGGPVDVRVDAAASNGSDPISAFPNSRIDGTFPVRGNSVAGPQDEATLPPAIGPKQVGFSEDSLKKLQEARETVPAECFDKGTTQEEKAAYVKKRNAIYSKRKYYKDKLRREGLTSSRDNLTIENRALKDENLRLEKLYEMAKIAVRAHESGASSGLPRTVVAGGASGGCASADHGLDLMVGRGKRPINAEARRPVRASNPMDEFGVGAAGASESDPGRLMAAAPSTAGALGRIRAPWTTHADSTSRKATTAAVGLSSSMRSPSLDLWSNPPQAGGNASGAPGAAWLPEALAVGADQRQLMAGRSAAEAELLRRRLLLSGEPTTDHALMQELRRERFANLPLQHQERQLAGPPPTSRPPTNSLAEMQLLRDLQQRQQEQQQQQLEQQRSATAAAAERSRGIEQVHQLLHEARIRQDLATQMALELAAPAPPTTTSTDAASLLRSAGAGQYGDFLNPPRSSSLQQEPLLQLFHQQQQRELVSRRLSSSTTTASVAAAAAAGGGGLAVAQSPSSQFGNTNDLLLSAASSSRGAGRDLGSSSSSRSSSRRGRREEEMLLELLARAQQQERHHVRDSHRRSPGGQP